MPKTLLPAMLSIAIAACHVAPAPDASTAMTPAVPEPVAAVTNMQQVFFDRISTLCGQAFAGKVLVDNPVSDGPNPFREQPLTMHVRECSEQEIRIPFHLGDDRSRTWVLTRTDAGLRLKHDHRHQDGSDDAVTMYGGDTVDEGSAERQEFPVDAFSQEMFTREGMTASNSNVWAMEIDPGRHFVYELARKDQDRLFRVDFDLTQPIAEPPAPWGAERMGE